jgi:hypothetical protein
MQICVIFEKFNAIENNLVAKLLSVLRLLLPTLSIFLHTTGANPSKMFNLGTNLITHPKAI